MTTLGLDWGHLLRDPARAEEWIHELAHLVDVVGVRGMTARYLGGFWGRTYESLSGEVSTLLRERYKTVRAQDGNEVRATAITIGVIGELGGTSFKCEGGRDIYKDCFETMLLNLQPMSDRSLDRYLGDQSSSRGDDWWEGRLVRYLSGVRTGRQVKHLSGLIRELGS